MRRVFFGSSLGAHIKMDNQNKHQYVESLDKTLFIMFIPH